MRKPLIAANWKMNLLSHDIKEFLHGLVLDSSKLVDISVFPPAVYIQQTRDALYGTQVHWGLQNVYSHLTGAFTGETSPLMARDLGCSYVIVGHSERRILFKESDENVAAKFCAVVDQLMNPILCVGETLEQRDNGDTMAVVSKQISTVLNIAGSVRLKSFTVAYEPVWAIGTGKTATPKQAQEVHAMIRKLLLSYGEDVAEKTRILYGGSVNSGNVDSLMNQADIDGGLVGSASLDLGEFQSICSIVR